MSLTTPFEIISQAKAIVQLEIEKTKWTQIEAGAVSNAACSKLIGRYTSAFAAEFQAWLGITYAFARHEDAQPALKDNLRCEMGDDHIGMLHRFAAYSKGTPHGPDREWVEPFLRVVRKVFQDLHEVGLAGLTILAVLENTSEIFIPILEKAAVHNGSVHLEYTKVHGPADAAHSVAFLKAMGKEQQEGYQSPLSIMNIAQGKAVSLVLRIFADIEE